MEGIRKTFHLQRLHISLLCYVWGRQGGEGEKPWRGLRSICHDTSFFLKETLHATEQKKDVCGFGFFLCLLTCIFLKLSRLSRVLRGPLSPRILTSPDIEKLWETKQVHGSALGLDCLYRQVSGFLGFCILGAYFWLNPLTRAQELPEGVCCWIFSIYIVYFLTSNTGIHNLCPLSAAVVRTFEYACKKNAIKNVV